MTVSTGWDGSGKVHRRSDWTENAAGMVNQVN
jgi:hypothetical protein